MTIYTTAIKREGQNNDVLTVKNNAVYLNEELLDFDSTSVEYPEIGPLTNNAITGVVRDEAGELWIGVAEDVEVRYED